MAVGQVAVGQGFVHGLFIRSSALPSVGLTKRSHFAAFWRIAAQPFVGSGLVSRQIRRSGFSD
ncbi:MAG: hypothetical protein JNK57_15535 [Planctomycetaceae bacterium]|nr:hypothetical protein [Planctomycetaceae bacterium]